MISKSSYRVPGLTQSQKQRGAAEKTLIPRVRAADIVGFRVAGETKG